MTGYSPGGSGMILRYLRLVPAFLALTAFALLSACVEPEAGLAGKDAPPQADEVHVVVDLSEQSMQVVRSRVGEGRTETYTWPVSTGRPGFETRTGTFQPTWLDADHKSSLYEDAPMPHSIFFHGHEAIHGTNWVSRLGRPASHGCVRLHPTYAAFLFAMVQEVGKSHTWITVQP